jgi:hypothetical protein
VIYVEVSALPVRILENDPMPESGGDRDLEQSRVTTFKVGQGGIIHHPSFGPRQSWAIVYPSRTGFHEKCVSYSLRAKTR